MFPSPIGELRFSIDNYFDVAIVDPRFRPLSGSYVSQLSIKWIDENKTVFPSPIGELRFSINIGLHR